MKRLWLLGLLGLATLLVAVSLWHTRAPATPRYLAASVERGAVAPAVSSSGTVNPVTVIQVGSYVSGVIQTISCDFNTRVKAGQLCAKIDPRPYQSTVAQETAALATARAQVDKDRANLQYATVIDARNADLLKRGIVSQETADTSTNALQQAKAQLALDQASVAQHQAQLEAARINLGYTSIVSPVDGTVVSRNVTQGQTVAASFQTPTLFLIATDLSKMQVDTNVSESDIGTVKFGNAALFTVTAYPDRQFSGKVQQVRQAPQTIQNVVTYDVVVGVDNPDLALMPGMTATIRILTARVDGVLRVPDQALRFRPSGRTQASGGDGAETRHVWVLRGDAPQRIAVKTGLDDGAWTQIISGALRAGEQVILSERAPAGAATAAASPTPVNFGAAAPRR
ncbi:efflux RND transporter periplasmic adaptor subunit [Rugamonas sp. FT107W]|uniref:Efflux RND transporter periplasmic adaptor subunit n=3 Tax=Duganella TaxID=75654 RepID=A0A845HGP8_9BURK|nr:efflux RND transporter periplasmic adaptor subunit [Duganella margarita]MYM73916.1 efflux RND transporter periplasmic adaptor subunit [Duganella margarita]MYN16765.1 efflux RND transporter periplasmic adaptor subunit [Duganella vulcania]